jgi:hypothetical protein
LHATRDRIPHAHAEVVLRRLLPDNAAILFSLVEQRGIEHTRIVVEHWVKYIETYLAPNVQKD